MNSEHESKRVLLTEQVADNQALNADVEQLRALLNATGQAMYAINQNGECIFINSCCLHLLGFHRDRDVVGRNMHELIHQGPEHADRRAIEQCAICNAQRAGAGSEGGDDVVWRHDGRAIPVEYFIHPIVSDEHFVGSVVTVQDVTQRKAMEAALARSEETLQRAQAIAHVGSWDWDIVNNTLYWTDEIYRIFGLSPQEFGATYDAFLHYIYEDDRQSVIDAVNNSVADSQIPYDIEHRVVRPNGEVRVVNERGKVYRGSDGSPERMIGTVQDITEKKLAAEEIRKLNEELEQRVERRTEELRAANSELQVSLERLREAQSQLIQSAKMAALGELVAGVAHEINTPIGVGVTAVTHMQMVLNSYEQRYHSGTLTRDDFEKLLQSTTESTRIVVKNLQRAADLIRSFKQVAVDQTSDELREFNVSDYLNELMHSLQPRLRKGTQSVSIRCPESLIMNSNPGALSQVFTNLVVNSVIHGFNESGQGEITIDVEQDSDDCVRIEYADNGAGIDPDNVKRVFDPFFTTRRGQGGSGLGLHIVYNLTTQSLGGKINCLCSHGKGAKFQLVLPRELHQKKCYRRMQQAG